MDLDQPDPDQYAADQLSRRRRLLGFTRERLAVMSGISADRVARYERGAHIPPATRLRIAEALQVTGDFFEWQKPTAAERRKELKRRARDGAIKFPIMPEQEAADAIIAGLTAAAEADLRPSPFAEASQPRKSSLVARILALVGLGKR